MGYNIAGLVINQNYDKDVKKLSNDLKIGIEIIEEITYDDASENWTPDEEFRLYFSDKGTIIFFPHEWAYERIHSRTANTLNYAYTATAMYFHVDLFNKGKLVRAIVDWEGERKTDYGEQLELEEKHETADGLTFALIDELLGTSFQRINGLNKAYKCKKNRIYRN